MVLGDSVVDDPEQWLASKRLVANFSRAESTVDDVSNYIRVNQQQRREGPFELPTRGPWFRLASQVFRVP